MSDGKELRTPQLTRDRVMKLVARRDLIETELEKTREELEQQRHFLELSGRCDICS